MCCPRWLRSHIYVGVCDQRLLVRTAPIVVVVLPPIVNQHYVADTAVGGAPRTRAARRGGDGASGSVRWTRSRTPAALRRRVSSLSRRLHL